MLLGIGKQAILVKGTYESGNNPGNSRQTNADAGFSIIQEQDPPEQ